MAWATDRESLKQLVLLTLHSSAKMWKACSAARFFSPGRLDLDERCWSTTLYVVSIQMQLARP